MPELFAFIPIIIIPIAWVLGIWVATAGFWIVIFLLNILIAALMLLFGSVLWITLAILQLSHFLAIINTALIILTYFYGLISRRDNIEEGVFSVMSYFGFSHSALMSLISKQRQNDVIVKEDVLGPVYVLFFIDFLILAFAFDFNYLEKFDFFRTFWSLSFLSWSI